ncbi:hypothetical protein ACQY0O_005695 [Thecaphora frezii]
MLTAVGPLDIQTHTLDHPSHRGSPSRCGFRPHTRPVPVSACGAVGHHLDQDSPTGLLPLAQACRHTRLSLLAVLYSAIAITGARQLELFVQLLQELPTSSPLEPAVHIRSLRLGPKDTLASASETSHYFSSVNFFPADANVGDSNDGGDGGRGSVDRRWILTARILERCASLQDLIIWDGLLGEPPTSTSSGSTPVAAPPAATVAAAPRYGLWALHPDARLQSLALPFLWRGGANLPSPEMLPGISELEQLDVVNSGLTTHDVRVLATFPRLKLFRWYYRPLGMNELEMLLETLQKRCREVGQGHGSAEDLQIFLAANNGMLAQIEGYLHSQTPGFVFIDPYLPIVDPDSRVASPEPPPRRLPPQVIPRRIRPRSTIQPAVLDQHETNFLFHRRRAGMQGFAPGAAPQLPQAWVDHLKALQQQQHQANQDSTAALPVVALPILGGFPTESAEDQFARRIMEREKRLEKARAERLQNETQGTFAAENQGRADGQGEAGGPLTGPSAIEGDEGDDGAERVEAVQTWIATAVEWFHTQRLVFDRRRWKRAVEAWEDEWQFDNDDDNDDNDNDDNDNDDNDNDDNDNDNEESDAHRRRSADVPESESDRHGPEYAEFQQGIETLLLSQLADL